jgi:hypothetical protein
MIMRRKHTRAVMAVVAMAGLCGLGAVAAPALAQGQAATRVDGTGPDTLIFRNGNTLKGEIVKETEKTVKIKSTTNGISFEMEYPKSDLLEIKRTQRADAKKDAKKDAKPESKLEAKPEAMPDASAAAALASTDGPATAADGTKYYYMQLTGDFGGQITQTPLREAVEDAYRNGARVLIFEVDADWNEGEDELTEEKKAFQQEFSIFRAVPVNDVFLKHIPSVYGSSPEDRPKVVFWIKNAMGGAAFVPMVSCERYFAPEGRMGGIGNLSTMHGGGSERVLEKWRGASLQTAMGFANWGCIPEIIIRGMSRVEQIVSVRYVDGKPEFFADYPKNPGEELLTDSGKEGEQDTIDLLARWQGNDVITLTAELATKLQLSKGTVTTREELLEVLDLRRNGVAVDQRVDRIIKGWADGLDRAKSRLLKSIRDYGEIQVQGTWEERRAARGRQQRLIDEIVTILRQYGEGMQPRWCFQNDIPLDDEGQPDINRFLNMKDRIKTDQQLDKR